MFDALLESMLELFFFLLGTAQIIENFSREKYSCIAETLLYYISQLAKAL